MQIFQTNYCKYLKLYAIKYFFVNFDTIGILDNPVIDVTIL